MVNEPSPLALGCDALKQLGHRHWQVLCSELGGAPPAGTMVTHLARPHLSIQRSADDCPWLAGAECGVHLSRQ